MEDGKEDRKKEGKEVRREGGRKRGREGERMMPFPHNSYSRQKLNSNRMLVPEKI